MLKLPSRKHNYLRAFICLVLVVFGGESALSEPPTDSKEILQLQNAFVQAWGKNDKAILNSIVADDFQYWSFKGTRLHKADLLRLVERSSKSGDTETDTKIEDPLVRVFGDTALFTALIIDSGKHANGEKFSEKSYVTVVYVRRDGKWQMVFDHDSPIQSPR
jgi:uncharacterized protein (TIGR02246 family)